MPLRHLLRTARRRGAGAAPAAPARRRLRSMLAAVFVALAVAAGLPVAGPAQAAPAVSYTNPLVNQRADPHIVKHTDGYYYMTATVPEYDRIVLRRATTLQGLATAPRRRRSGAATPAGRWAPTSGRRRSTSSTASGTSTSPPGRTDDVWRIRMYVLENAEREPADRLVDRTRPDHDAVGHVQPGRLDVRRQRGAVSDLGPAEPGISTNSNVYLARMGANPWQITGTVTRLVVPTYDWETRGYRVAEGPAVIQRNGRIFLTYSASATDANYCLGMLTASAGANLLDAAVLGQEPQPGVRQQRRHRSVRPRATTRSPSPRTGRATSSSTTTATTGTSPATRSTTRTGGPGCRRCTGTPTAPRTSASRCPTGPPRCGCGHNDLTAATSGTTSTGPGSSRT